MKIAFICDTHMPDDKISPQYAFLTRAVEKMKENKIDAVISLGDITSYGEEEAFEIYLQEMSRFNHYYVIGNSDVRDERTCDKFCEKASNIRIDVGKRSLLGINTPFAIIKKEDREEIKSLSDGDILVMHHGLHRLEAESREFVENAVKDKSITIIHAHSHMRFDYQVGKARVIGLRALDGDKSIGDFPCITYFNITDEDFSFEEKLIDVNKEIIFDVRKYFGLSCVDNHKDVLYALENNVKYIELRLNGADWYPDMSLLPLIENWRKKTDGYLSVHMPNIYYGEKGFRGEDTWYKAVDYAKQVKADALTIHPPRVKKSLMTKGSNVWNKFLELYKYAVNSMEDSVKIGIENLHMEPDERDDENRAFGYNPKEVSAWIEAIDEGLGKKGRTGHLLDVGHARNNGEISQKFPIGRWYTLMGKKTVAYHIHQVVPREEGGLKNHQAIENWFGPVISYVSFFYSWGEGLLNHMPVFLEVRGSENFEKSIKAFEKTFERDKSYE